jgi:hypothetical protein
MGSSSSRKKKKACFFISVRVCLLHSCFYSTNKSSSYISLFFFIPSSHLKKKPCFALKCSYKGKYTVAMFEKRKERHKNTKRFCCCFFFNIYIFFTGKVSLISRGIWLEEKNNKQTNQMKRLKKRGRFFFFFF